MLSGKGENKWEARSNLAADEVDDRRHEEDYVE